jgi:hypothetical protein
MKAEFSKQKMVEVAEPQAANPTGAPPQRRTANRFTNINGPTI